MLSRYDRIVFSLIALALAVIAMNPWIAPGYVSAQGTAAKVNIAEIGGHTVHLPLSKLTDDVSGIPVIILNVNDLRK